MYTFYVLFIHYIGLITGKWLWKRYSAWNWAMRWLTFQLTRVCTTSTSEDNPRGCCGDANHVRVGSLCYCDHLWRPTWGGEGIGDTGRVTSLSNQPSVTRWLLMVPWQVGKKDIPCECCDIYCIGRCYDDVGWYLSGSSIWSEVARVSGCRYPVPVRSIRSMAMFSRSDNWFKYLLRVAYAQFSAAVYLFCY